MTQVKLRPHTFSLFLLVPVLLSAHAFGSNPIQSENAKLGTTAWQISKGATNHQIEGYASATSVNRGGSISLFTNTTDSSYSIEIFRMGWYGGLGGRRMMPTIQLSGTQQPACPVVDANTFTWQGVDQELDGEPIADTQPIKVTRQGPAK